MDDAVVDAPTMTMLQMVVVVERQQRRLQQQRYSKRMMHTVHP
jgi:hypothetical protein